MRAKFEKTKFIKIMEDTPFISFAAKKAGIARATIYRWRKSNPDFRDAIEEALKSGRSHLCDIAEMTLVEKIKSKDMGAIKFYLQHNDPRYRPVRTAFIPLPPKVKLKPGEVCEACGQGEKYSNLSDKEIIEQLRDSLEDEGYTVIEPRNDTMGPQ